MGTPAAQQQQRDFVAVIQTLGKSLPTKSDRTLAQMFLQNAALKKEISRTSVCLFLFTLTSMTELESELTQIRTGGSVEFTAAEREYARQLAVYTEQTAAMQQHRTQLQRELAVVQQEGEQRVTEVCFDLVSFRCIIIRVPVCVSKCACVCACVCVQYTQQRQLLEQRVAEVLVRIGLEEDTLRAKERQLRQWQELLALSDNEVDGDTADADGDANDD